jgi:hypothetical protein
LIALNSKQKVLNFRKICTPKFLGFYAHEPSELLHVEGRAAAEGIDGSGLELGLGDGGGLVVPDRGKNPREERIMRL